MSFKLQTLNRKLGEAEYAAEQGVSDEEALKKGMEEKSKEFRNDGAEVCAKAY